MDFISIRGATTVKYNDRKEILDSVKELIEEIEVKNNIDRDQVLSINFSTTQDLDKVYPAVAARNMGYTHASLMCFQEMQVEASLEKCIRLSFLCKSEKKQSEAIHIYQKEAKNLRPDLDYKANSSDRPDKGRLVIAIDGPASAGKSSLARNLARALKITYIDTGAMYRALTYKILMDRIDILNRVELNMALANTEIDFKDGHIILDGKNVDEEIRENYISQNVSNISTIKEVRDKLVEIQRRLGREESVVMDGRDIGTVVLPDANFKFFITASVEERARRRYRELVDKGNMNISLSQIEEEIKLRDQIDTNREIAPLVASEDAIIIDNSQLSMEETLEKILKIIRGKNAI